MELELTTAAIIIFTVGHRSRCERPHKLLRVHSTHQGSFYTHTNAEHSYRQLTCHIVAGCRVSVLTQNGLLGAPVRSADLPLTFADIL